MVRKLSWENSQSTGCGGKRGVKGDLRARFLVREWVAGALTWGHRKGVQVTTTSLGGDCSSLSRTPSSVTPVIMPCWLGLLDRWPVKFILLELVFPFLDFCARWGFGWRMKKTIKPCSEMWHHQLQSCRFIASDRYTAQRRFPRSRYCVWRLVSLSPSDWPGGLLSLLQRKGTLCLLLFWGWLTQWNM